MSRTPQALPTLFKLAIVAIFIVAIGGAALLFLGDEGESQQASLATAGKGDKQSAENEKRSKKTSRRSTRELLENAPILTREADANSDTQSDDEKYLDNRRAFRADDPSTWNDILDPSKVPVGFDPKDPKTWPILERAYNAELSRRITARAKRRAARSNSNRSNGSADQGKSQSSGTLDVTVVDEGGAPIVGVAVYPPLTRNLELYGGQVNFEAEETQRLVKTGSDGKASFDAAQIALSSDKSWPALARVVVQDTAYATVVRDFKTVDLQRRANSIRVTLLPAVFVEVKVVDREGNAVPKALVSVKQGEGQYAEMKEAFSAEADGYGQFNLKVARDYRYIFNVSAQNYVPFTTRAFDFARDERIVSVTLQAGRGVEGFVYDGGKGVAGARVHSETDGVSATSDANGYFVLVGLKDQIYSNRLRVRVTKVGHAPVVTSILVNEQNLQIDLPQEGKISGTVTRDGNPVPSATITASIVQDKQTYQIASVVSDLEGAFTLKGIGEGKVTLIAAAQGGFSPATALDGKAREEQSGVELKLGAGGSVLGSLRATFAGGGDGPLGGVTVMVDGKAAMTVTSDGSFYLDGLSAGAHSITLAGSGSVPAELRPFNVLAIAGEPQRYFTLPAPHKITSKLGEEVRVDLHLVEFLERTHREISIRFQLNVADDIAGVEVALTPSVASAPNGHKTAPILFTFTLSGGSYTKEKVALLEDVKYSAVIQHPRIHRKTINDSELASVPHEGLLQVDLQRARSFRAYVKDSSGNAVVDVGARINGVSGSKGSGNAQTDQHGYFEIGGLEEGTFQVVLFKNSYYELRQNVTLTNQDSEIPTLTLLGANEIRVRVLGAGGAPVPGAAVWAMRPANNDPKSAMQYFGLGETDGEGRKVVNFHWIRHYQVTAIKGSEIAAVNFDNLKESPVREFDIQLEPHQIISGTLRAAVSQKEIGDTDIYASLESGSASARANKYFTRTKGNGTFSIYVPLGTHSITVRETRVYLETVNSGIASGAKNIAITADPRDQVEGNWAEMVAFSAPQEVVAGQTFYASLTLNNKGSTNWNSAGKYALGPQSPRDTNRWGTTRVQLNGTVQAGDSYTFNLELKAPTKAGTYNLQWRMVQDGREWFGELSALLRVKVVAAPKAE